MDSQTLILVAALFAITVFALREAVGLSRPAFAYIKRPVMTANELSFYRVLVAALPGHIVCPQVAMSAVMTAAGRTRPDQRRALRNRFDRKVVDYVLLTRAGETVALIELDDSTHDPARDFARDALTASAGLRTIRFHSRPRPTYAAIQQAVADLRRAT